MRQQLWLALFIFLVVFTSLPQPVLSKGLLKSSSSSSRKSDCARCSVAAFGSRLKNNATKKKLHGGGLPSSLISHPKSEEDASSSIDLWSKFYKALSNKFQLGDNGLMVSQKYPIDPFLDVSTGLFALSNFVDTVPMWGPMYSSSGKAISKGYSEAVDSLYMEVNQQAYDQAQAWLTKYNLAFQIWQKCINGLTAQWINFHNSQSALPPQDQTSYTDWYKENSQQCDPLKSNADSAREKYQFYLTQSAHTGYEFVVEAQENLNATSSFMSVFSGTNTFSVLAAAIPGLLDTVNGWYSNQGLAPDGFQIDSESSTASEWKWAAEGETFAWDDFIGFESEGSWNRHSIDSQDSQFSMSVNYQALSQFSISRTPWFDASILETPQTWISSSPLGKGVTEIGGPKGLVDLIPTSIIVGFQPSVSIKLTQDDYQYFTENWQSESGIEIGPFFFGSESSGSDTTWTKDDKTLTVTFADKSLSSSLVAVVVDRIEAKAEAAPTANNNQLNNFITSNSLTAQTASMKSWLQHNGLNDLAPLIAKHQIQLPHLSELDADLMRELVPQIGRRLDFANAINSHLWTSSKAVFPAPAPLLEFITQVSTDTENNYAKIFQNFAGMDTIYFTQKLGGRTVYSNNVLIGNLKNPNTPLYGHATWVIYTSSPTNVNINRNQVHITYNTGNLQPSCHVYETGACSCTVPDGGIGLCNWPAADLRKLKSYAMTARNQAVIALVNSGVTVTDN